MKFGIIGFGRFGKLWAECLTPYGEVLVYDICTKLRNCMKVRKLRNMIQSVTLAEVVKCDILFLLVPISAMEICCDEISSLLNKNTLVVDACSVKIYSAKIMKKILPPRQSIITTHPLFGPDSTTQQSLAGHKIVVCPVRVTNKQKKIFIDLLKKLKLEIIESTPQEHDRRMARSQALVHFIGRGLTKLKLVGQDISTPDYVSLLRMNTMVQNDTWQLFFDMQKYNPYSVEIRKVFLKELQQLENKIEQYESKN